MSLFQKSVEKKYIKQLDSKLVATKYDEFKAYFGNPKIQENIRNSKEEQFQESFLSELFVKFLGYTQKFEKLRFYIDNAIKFNLFKLTKPEFENSYLCNGKSQ